MSFLTFFRSNVPEILIRLKAVRLELSKAQHDIERLLILEQNLALKELNAFQYNELIRLSIDGFGVALWIKDDSGRFVFANKICCDKILKCQEEDALNFTDADFEKDALAKVCLKSDKVVRESLKTKRFIEHAVYNNGDGEEIFLDVVKSPRIVAGEFVGTTGCAIVITSSIPKEIRDQHKFSSSIEIPVEASMGTHKLIELLERRNIEMRDEKNDEKFQKWRKENNLMN